MRRPHRRRARATASSGGCTTRPLDCRSCRRCSRASRLYSRREAAIRNRATPSPAAPRRREPFKLGLGKLVLATKRDPAAHKRQAGGERFDERRKNRVEEHIRVFRVMHDVLDLVGKEPRIDRVQNASRAGYAIIDFQMAPAVPGEGRDAIAVTCPQRVERVRDAFGARGDFSIVRAMNRPFRVARYDLAAAMPGRGVIDEARNQKRTALHQPEHDSLPRPRWALSKPRARVGDRAARPRP